MPAVASGMTQMNVRVNAERKQEAESVLKLANSSLTELVRMLIDKVSCGAKDLQEVQHVLQGDAANVPKDDTDSVLLEGWALVDGFCADMGIVRSDDWLDERTCEQVYEEAMMAHYEEKGLLQ